MLPNTHTPQDSGASLNGPRGPIKDHSLLSILKEQCQNSAEKNSEANGTCLFMRELGQRRIQCSTEAKVHALVD